MFPCVLRLYRYLTVTRVVFTVDTLVDACLTSTALRPKILLLIISLCTIAHKEASSYFRAARVDKRSDVVALMESGVGSGYLDFFRAEKSLEVFQQSP